MNYSPITVTADNFDEAIRENILSAIKVLKSKVHAYGGPWPKIDAEGSQVRLVATSDLPQAACTLEKLLELIA